jgi:hypothetical protein
VRDVDLRHRPASARGGVVRFGVGGETVVARSRGTVFEVARPDGGAVNVPAARRATAAATGTEPA